MQEAIDLMQQQLAMLINIADNLKAPKLGFHAAPRLTTIYANRAKCHTWYVLEGGEPMPIEHDAITGYVTDLKFEKAERRGKESIKLHLYLNADRPYRIECGHDTMFAYGLLISFASIPSAQLRYPVTIAAQPSTQEGRETILFSKVYLGSNPVGQSLEHWTDITKWDDVPNEVWRQITKEAIDNVKGIHR